MQAIVRLAPPIWVRQPDPSGLPNSDMIDRPFSAGDTFVMFSLRSLSVAVKGAVTLAIYVAIGITGAAFGQQSVHPMNMPPTEMSYRSPFSPSSLTSYVPVPPGWTPKKLEPATDRAGSR